MKIWILPVMVLAIACGDDEQTESDAANDAAIVATNPDGTPVAAIELANTNIGQGSTASLRVTNTGTTETGPIAVSINGLHANDFVIDNQLSTCSAVALAPGQTCDVALEFRPMEVGVRTAVLAIVSDPGGAISVPLTGHAVMPDLHFNPTSVTFGTLEVGQNAQATIELRNDGSGMAPIDSIEIAGTGFTRGISTCGATLAPGTSCDIAIAVNVQTLGALPGGLTVNSNGAGYTAPLSARGARRITVVREGTGGGTITSSPSGIDCGSSCTALYEGDVMLTAAPGANSQLTSWSVPGCGQSSTCTVTADITPITVNVSFALTGSSSLDLVFAGNASGEVQVTRNDAASTICFASCNVPIEPGDMVRVSAATPSKIGGIAGACTSTAAECTFTAPIGASTVTVTFDKDPKELWTRLVFPDEAVIAVAYDTTGNVIAATPQHLTKLSSAGVTQLTRTIPVSGLATGPGDTIYVVTGSDLKKLDASLADVWTRALDVNSTTTCGSIFEPQQCVAVGADGAVAVHGTAGVTRWDANGTLSWSKPIASSVPGVVIDTQGVVYVAIEDSSAEGKSARRFMPDGSEAVQFDSVGSQYHGEFAVDSMDLLVTSTSGHSNAWLIRTLATGVRDYFKLFSGGFAAYVENGVATSATGRIAWWYLVDDFAPVQHRISVLNNDGSPVWTFDHGQYEIVLQSVGPIPEDLAYSAAGQVAIAGRFAGITYDGGWIQAYAP